MITLTVDNLILTPFIQQTVDVRESMRKVYGQNGGLSVNGGEFVDLVATYIDPSFRLKPLPRPQYAQVMELMKRPTVTVRYTTVLGDNVRSITAAPAELTAHYIVDSYGVRIYDGETISFRQVSV